MLSFFRQLAERTDSSSSSTFFSRAGLKGRSGLDRPADLAFGLFEGDEDLELVLQDAGGVGHGVNRRDRAVGFDFQHQLVVVQRLALTGRLDAVGDLLDRRIQRVDGDQADRRVFRTVAVGGT
jgi:hypothetical protein